MEPGALSRKVLWEARTAQLDLLCACGRRPVELKVLGCCRLCYHGRYHSLRWFGGLRELILKRDRFRCRLCGVGRPLVVHHGDERNAKPHLAAAGIAQVAVHEFAKAETLVQLTHQN